MSGLLFDEYDGLPEGFLSARPEDLHRCVPRPAIIRLPGIRAPAVAVVLMLHGNEPVGLQAVQQLLQHHAGRRLPRALTLVVGNVEAAALGQRHLDRQPDFNRIWPGTEQYGSQESRMFAQIVDRLREDSKGDALPPRRGLTSWPRRQLRGWLAPPRCCARSPAPFPAPASPPSGSTASRLQPPRRARR